MLTMIVAAAPGAFAQGDDWERVPSAPAAGANAPSGAAGGMLGGAAGKMNPGCEMAGRFAEAAAKARDRGQSEQAQLQSVDDPHGTLHRLAAASRVPAETADALGEAMHREIAYAYAHPKLTPAQLRAHFEGECAHPSAAGE